MSSTSAVALCVRRGYSHEYLLNQNLIFQSVTSAEIFFFLGGSFNILTTILTVEVFSHIYYTRCGSSVVKAVNSDLIVDRCKGRGFESRVGSIQPSCSWVGLTLHGCKGFTQVARKNPHFVLFFYSLLILSCLE